MKITRLPDGKLRVPLRAESPGVIGDGTQDIGTGDKGYELWEVWAKGNPELVELEGTLAREHGPAPFPGAVFDAVAHRWKQPNQKGQVAGGKGQEKQPLSDDQRKAVAGHVLPGLDAKIAATDPEAAKKPGVLAWAHERAVNAMARVGVLLLDHQDLIGGILGAVFDTPKDMEKFGYNPSVSSGGHQSAILDPTRDHLGISTHLAATIATHVLSAGIAFARKKLAGRSSEAAAANVADLVAELLGILSEEFGLPKPDPAAIAAALGGS